MKRIYAYDMLFSTENFALALFRLAADEALLKFLARRIAFRIFTFLTGRSATLRDG